MLQMLLALIQVIAIVLLSLFAIAFAIVAVLRWRKKRPALLLAGLGALSATLALGIWSFDLFSAESADRAELVPAFRSNFGFDPPASVKEEIKLKNVAIYDASGHWMAFTYDPQVFDRIVAHDQPLQVAYANTSEFDTMVREFYMKDQNRPDWAVSPDGHANRILYKKDFLDHTFSEYYLWVDTVEAMVHLHVSYFD